MQQQGAAVLPRFFLLVCSFPRLLFPSSAFPPRPSNCFSTTINLLHNHFPNHPTTTFQPRLNHNPTKRNGRVGFAALLSAPSSSFRPSDRKLLVRAITVLVLSIVHPSFQPRLNHGKMLHKHFPSIQQPRSIRPFNHNSTSTTPRPRSNRPCPVLSTIHPSVHPLPNRTSTTQPQNKRRARIPRRPQGGAAKGGLYAGCKSAAPAAAGAKSTERARRPPEAENRAR